MNSVLLLLNGEIKDGSAVRGLARKAKLIVAADGGLRHALRLRIRPRIVIGDMDSLPRPLPKIKGMDYLCDFDENRSDFEKALSFLGGLEERPALIWVAGALGGRLDHSLVNLALAERFGENLSLVLVGDGSARLLSPGRHSFASLKGELISLCPAGGSCRVTTRGLRYPLVDERLARGSRGLSNRALGKRFELRVHGGMLWALRPGMGLASRKH